MERNTAHFPTDGGFTMGFSTNGTKPPYVPRIHELIRVNIPDLSPNDIFTVACSKGSEKRGKILIECSQGPQFKTGNIQLIWKRGSRSWTAWFMGKRYDQVQVRAYE